MFSKIIKSTIFTVGISTTLVQAQNEYDALQYANTQLQGTARSIGFGSALGSIGGDFSSLNVNPAGIGIYRRTEFEFSPSLMFNNSTSEYAGNSSTNTGNGTHFSISNMGLVLGTMKNRMDHNKNSIAFAVGFNRIADFTRNYEYKGINTTSSASWVMEQDANAPNSPLYAATADSSNPVFAAFNCNLLNYDTAFGGFKSVVNPTISNPISQSKTIKERGGITEVNLTIGGNIEEKVLFGFSLGLPILSHTTTQSILEKDLSGNLNNYFDNFSYTSKTSTTGAGVNLKLGMILKPNKNLRLGLAYHTPTLYGLTDISNASVTANTENLAGQRTYDCIQREYDYNYVAPGKIILSATLLAAKNGFITADYEYSNLGNIKYKSTSGNSADNDFFQYTNALIKNKYQGASNIKIGGEFKINNFMARAGVGYFSSPIKNQDASHFDLSCGFGFRFKNSFLDFGYVHRQFKFTEEMYNAYDGKYAPTAKVNTTKNNFVTTLGFKF